MTPNNELCNAEQDESNNKAGGDDIAEANGRACIDEFVLSIFDYFKERAHQHNLQTNDVPVGLERPFGRALPGQAYTARFVVKTNYWAISVVCHNLLAEFYLIPAVEILDLLRCETPSRKKLTISLKKQADALLPIVDNQPVNEEDLALLCHGLFKDMIKKSLASKHTGQGPTAALQAASMGNSITGAIRDLLAERGKLIQSLVTESEGVRNQIAREIHDDVINDLLHLSRTLRDEETLAREAIASSVEAIVLKLRQVCYDLAPRDLRDWGLPVVLKDLVVRLGTRIQAQCTFDVSPDLPRLEHDVELQIYRIVQECLTNVEKHARASLVQVSALYQDDHILQFSIEDNGVGFDIQNVAPSKGSSLGTSIIRERCELIALHHPADLAFTTAPGKGTKVVLSVRRRASFR